ncbi:hypothetical protein NDI43_09700 [Microcoleus vaginatus GB2-A3]|uniref:hypothetical protein n=1 Tax=Microcoleus vaginatus TaxID=119532 RepID=UPI0032A6DA4D
MSNRISNNELAELKEQFKPLIGQRFRSLSLPIVALATFEPSQIGTIVGTLMDALIPHLDIHNLGLKKHKGILGEREGYPDYSHESGKRLELKLLYVDNPDLKMKKPPTPREPSARLTQKVTVKNVDSELDAMLLIAYRIEVDDRNQEAAVPRIIDLELLSMIELIEARDKRMIDAGGRWFGNYETPTILSNIGREKCENNIALNTSIYGRKESENKDFNEDTNFGKLKRIPHPKLQKFLAKYRLATGSDQISLDTTIDELIEIDENELQDEERD